MAYWLDANQLAEACSDLGLENESRALEAAAQIAAAAIARKLKIKLTDDASTQPGFGGLCAGFGPAVGSGRMPKLFRDSKYDDEGAWA